MALSRPKLNFVTSPSGLLVPNTADNSGLDAIDVTFELDTPSDVGQVLRGDGTWDGPVEIVSTDPAIPNQGEAVFNTVTGEFSVFDGSDWWRVVMTSGGGGGGGVTYESVIQGDSPSVYYRLEETSGTNAVDSSGHSRDGTYSGSPTLGVASLIDDGGTCVTFDGSNDQVQLPTTNAYVGAGGEFTLEAWIKCSSVGANSQIIGADTGGGSRWLQWRVDSSRHLNLVLFNTSGSVSNSDASTSIVDDGAVHHVVTTFDGSNVKIYVDGHLETTSAWGGGTPMTSNSGVWVGQRGNGGLYFPGTIDEVAIYPTALTAGQVLAHFTAAAGGSAYAVAVIANSPVMYLRLNEGSGTVCVDSSGNGHTGTCHGTVTRGVASGGTGALGFGVTLGGTTSDYIDVPDDAALDITGDFTYEAWVKPSAIGSTQYIMGKCEDSGGSAGGYGLYMNSSGALALQRADLTLMATGSAALSAGAWSHVAVTRSGTTVTFYINGSVDFSTTSATAVQATNEKFHIGQVKEPSGRFFPWGGSLDEIAVYATALSGTDIAAHYAAR